MPTDASIIITIIILRSSNLCTPAFALCIYSNDYPKRRPLLRAGYIRSCKDAEFIGNKHAKSYLFISTDTYDRIVVTDSGAYFQFRFPPLVCFYSVVEVE